MRTDSQLQSDVMAELRWQPGIDAANIGVAVKNGIVTLTGTVPSYTERYNAEAAVKRVYGVTAVVNNIEVRLPGSIGRTDQEIAADAVKELRWNVRVPQDRIKLTVSNKWIRLEGEVDLLPLDAREIHADAQCLVAAEGIDGWPPPSRAVWRQVRLRVLVGDLAQLPLQPAQLDRAEACHPG